MSVVVVTSGGGGKGWVGSLEFRSWRFIEREKKNLTRRRGRRLFGEEKYEMGLGLWSFGHGGF